MEGPSPQTSGASQEAESAPSHWMPHGSALIDTCADNIGMCFPCSPGFYCAPRLPWNPPAHPGADQPCWSLTGHLARATPPMGTRLKSPRVLGARRDLVSALLAARSRLPGGFLSPGGQIKPVRICQAGDTQEWEPRRCKANPGGAGWGEPGGGGQTRASQSWMRAKEGLQSVPSPQSCPEQEFELCCFTELVWQEFSRNLGAVRWKTLERGKSLRSIGSSDSLQRQLLSAPRPNPLRVRRRVGPAQPWAASSLQFWNFRSGRVATVRKFRCVWHGQISLGQLGGERKHPVLCSVLKC